MVEARPHSGNRLVEANNPDRRVLVTRPALQAGELMDAITAAGWSPQLLPMLDIAMREDHQVIDQLQQALADIVAGGNNPLAIFVSTNAVSCTARLLSRASLAWPRALRCVAIGPATLASIEAQGWPLLDWSHCLQNGESFVDTTYSSEQLLQQLAQLSMRERLVYIFSGAGGRRLLDAELSQRGAQVIRLETYHRERPNYSAAAFDRAIEHFLAGGEQRVKTGGTRSSASSVLMFASGETLANFLSYARRSAYRQQLASLACVVPGERVAQLAREGGQQRVIVADNASQVAFLHALQSL